jgi:nitric oxide reductase NorD protein
VGPESVIAEGVLHATRLLRRLWTAGRPPDSDEQAPVLPDMRRRLELFVGAVFPTVADLGTADPAAPPSLLERVARRGTSHLHVSQAFPSVSGQRVLLPGSLGLPPAASLLRYRLLALEQAARIDRGTMAAHPMGDVLLQDLYSLAEAAAVDATLGRLLPRLAPSLQVARRKQSTRFVSRGDHRTLPLPRWPAAARR